MNEPTHDLAALWRSDERRFDAAGLRKQFEREERQRRQVERATLLAHVFVVPIVLWMDLQGAFVGRGFLSLLLIASAIVALGSLQARRRRDTAAPPQDTRAALEAAIHSARRMIRRGVAVAVGWPLSIGSGYAIGPLLHASDGGFDGARELLWLLIAFLAVSCVISTLWGVARIREGRAALAALSDLRDQMEEDDA